MEERNFQLKGTFWNGSYFKFGASVIIRSLSTGLEWRFPAFVNSFQDSYKTNWNTTDVYGRQDPIYTYKSTARTISIGLNIVAFDMSQAFDNWVSINEMAQSVYPLYKDVSGEKVISSPPLFGIKFQNLLREVATGEVLEDFLYGVFTNGITISPDMKNGFLFDQNMIREHWSEPFKAIQYRKLKENYGFGDKEPESGLFILPKFYDMKFDFAVLHTVFRGNQKGKKLSKGGPMLSASYEDAKEFSSITRTDVDNAESLVRNIELIYSVYEDKIKEFLSSSSDEGEKGSVREFGAFLESKKK